MLRRRVLALLVTVIPVLATTAEPQDGNPRDEQEPFRVQVEAVNVLVTVLDRETGKFITDLDRNEFRITEDGVEQQITNFSRQTDLPLTIGMCIDTSSSVRVKLKFEQEAAVDFLYSIMKPKDKALLAEFDTGVTLLHDFTSNPNDLVQEINRLRAGGGTSLYDAIYLVAEQKMLDETGRKMLIVMSDGSDLTSKRTFQEAMEMAHRSDVTIYAVSTTRFGADVDHEGDNALRQLTESTGGRVFFPYSASQLSSAFAEIEEELRSQYNLAYVPSNGSVDGGFRTIKVEVGRRDVRVRHREGYYAPGRPVS